MNRRAVLLSVPVLPALAWAKEPNSATSAAEPEGEVAIVIHDSHGVSCESALDGVCEIILFQPHTHIHLKISNISTKSLTLWRPSCPEGDSAMTIEFRELGKPDEVFRSGLRQDYTGGAGTPKVLNLAPGSDLIVNVDFLQGYWTMPIPFAVDGWREVEIRAVYHPEDKAELAPGEVIQRAWGGRAVSPWRKVRISNRTGKAIASDRRVK